MSGECHHCDGSGLRETVFSRGRVKCSWCDGSGAAYATKGRPYSIDGKRWYLRTKSTVWGPFLSLDAAEVVAGRVGV